MTAKTKHGFHGGHHTRGADHGTPHERLMRDHRRPGRSEGAPLFGRTPLESPANPPMDSMNQMPMMGPQTDGETAGMPGSDEEGPPGEEPDADDQEATTEEEAET